MAKQDDEKRTERVGLAFSPSEIERLDDWGFAQRIRARSEVIRRLAMRQLDQELHEAESNQ